MAAVDKVVIVGGGVAGMTSAILLAEAGVAVDVLELKDDISALGSGITVQGNALRVFEHLGIWETIQKTSYSFDSVGLRAPGPEAQIIAEIPDQRTGGPHLPATAGMYRPDLARILSERATDLGVKIIYGTSVTALTQDDSGVDVVLSDGTSKRYDLVIGSDGLHSKVRELIGIDVTPRRTGMGIWRAFVPRPKSVTHTELIYGGPCFIAGYCPTSEDMMYAYLVEPSQERTGLSDAESVEIVKGLAMGYGGPWNEIRESLSAESRTNYTWFTEHLVPDSWNRGRVVLIGDAAHSCPPTIAQGAAMAAEDGLVLAELLVSRNAVDQDFWDEFNNRRIPRASQVVAASVQLGDWLMEGRRDAPIPQLMGTITALVSVEP